MILYLAMFAVTASVCTCIHLLNYFPNDPTQLVFLPYLVLTSSHPLLYHKAPSNVRMFLKEKKKNHSEQ